MLPDKVREFATQTHRGVLTTFRRNGAAQMSIISCGSYRDGIAFTVTEDRVKLRNLRRNPRCSLLVSQESWWDESKLMPAGTRIADWMSDMLEAGAEYVDIDDLPHGG